MKIERMGRIIQTIILIPISSHRTVHRGNNGGKKHTGRLLVLISQHIDTMNYRFIVLSSSAFVNGKESNLSETFGNIPFIRQRATGIDAMTAVVTRFGTALSKDSE
jgi:hypothetical protein